MEYELAKELKDAGFPQTRHDIRLGDFHLMNPTLPELIEACGDEFRLLKKTSKGWRARPQDIEIKRNGFLGKTPEEAVARLWLALNKK